MFTTFNFNLQLFLIEAGSTANLEAKLSCHKNKMWIIKTFDVVYSISFTYGAVVGGKKWWNDLRK